jgi:hypothetical protein
MWMRDDKPSLDDLINGNVNPLSLINEPPVFVLPMEEPKAESAEARAKRRWFNRAERPTDD